MYINRKDGTLVRATIVTGYNSEKCDWEIDFMNGKTIIMSDKDFQEQYGEAMICPDKECYKHSLPRCKYGKPHICNNICEVNGGDKCPKCISYIPEEYDVDNEPVFPICGTCNARKSNLSWLMLTPEQLNKVVWRYTDKEKQTYALGTIIKEIAKAQINHLAKPEFGIFKLIDGEFIRFEHYLKENEK